MAKTHLDALKQLLGGSLPDMTSAQLPEKEHKNLLLDTPAQSELQTSIPESPERITSARRAPLATPAMEPLTCSLKSLTTDEPSSEPSLPPIQSASRFCPFAAVISYPYKFVRRPEFCQQIASRFFDQQKIRQRQWDLYYLWTEDYLTPKPIIFVAETQFQALLAEINNTFPHMKLKLTSWHQERGFVIDFQCCPPEWHPRFLGCADSKDLHLSLSNSITRPTPITHHKQTSSLRVICELAMQVSKKGSKKKQTKAIEAMQKAEFQLDMTQHLTNLCAGDQAAVDGFADEQDVIFIAIDVEAYEYNQTLITEVGVATLDMRDQFALPKGDDDLRQLIRARHFLVAEHRHLVNSHFVAGCPDRFEFGTSEIVPRDEMPQVLTSCFHQPFSKVNEMVIDEDRKIILVGHNISSDINYCESIGFSVTNRSSLRGIIDTASVFRVLLNDRDQRSLGSIMQHYELDAWNLHNAGNDAVYTLWALLKTGADKRKQQNDALRNESNPAMEVDRGMIRPDENTMGEDSHMEEAPEVLF